MKLYEYLFDIAETVAKRSSCMKRKVGAVLVNYAGHILATGYNEAPSGLAHCDNIACFNSEGTCVRTTHAEMNLLYQCAKRGVSMENTAIFLNLSPCRKCSKALMEVGVKECFFITQWKEHNSDLFANWYSKDFLDTPKHRIITNINNLGTTFNGYS